MHFPTSPTVLEFLPLPNIHIWARYKFPDMAHIWVYMYATDTNSIQNLLDVLARYNITYMDHIKLFMDLT